MLPTGFRRERALVGTLASVLIVNAFLFLLSKNQTFVHIDAIAHVNKARVLFDSITPGFQQIGSIWLPLPHLLILPLTAIDTLWRSGTAGSLLSLACFAGTSVFLFSIGYWCTGSTLAGWIAFLFFALNPRLIYLFTTPMTEPLMVFCAAGLFSYLIRWTQDESWTTFAMACLMAFAGTLTRYEGWAIAAVAGIVVPIVAVRRRIASTILFAGAAAAGPMLWMLYNMFYFDDPLFFTYGPGSARDYSQEYLLRTGYTYATSGKFWDSLLTYFVDVAYCLNPSILWLGLAGLVVSLAMIRRREWRPTFVLFLAGLAPFAFYVYSLYSNTVPLLMPGMVKDQPYSIMNVRYGSVMAAMIPVFAAMFVVLVIQQVDRHRKFALLLLPLLFLPDPVPAASLEPITGQLTQNLFYKESVRNQGFWMPPFVEVAERLKADMDSTHDQTSLVLTNTRIVHVVVWSTGIPMRRFVNETNKGYWEPNLYTISPSVRWVITEEGDQLWNAQGKVLQTQFIEIAHAKTPSTRTVHLYRRP